MKLTAKVRHIETLRRSDGWKVLRQIMQEEMVIAATHIAKNRAMTMDEINFRRGAIWAAEQLLNLPDRVLQELETQLLMEKPGAPSDEEE